jgi:hypothetical protein
MTEGANRPYFQNSIMELGAMFDGAQADASMLSESQTKISAKIHLPPSIDLSDLPTIPSPQEKNERAAIVAAWTALEALSPQTYRRPEDLAAGDRQCVADLTTGQVPWGTCERSRPKRQLYYRVVPGAIQMDGQRWS